MRVNTYVGSIAPGFADILLQDSGYFVEQRLLPKDSTVHAVRDGTETLDVDLTVWEHAKAAGVQRAGIGEARNITVELASADVLVFALRRLGDDYALQPEGYQYELLFDQELAQMLGIAAK